MPVSTKGEYAARALLQLALAFEAGTPVRAVDIAREQDIPRKYLEQILLLLKERGLVQSKRGVRGGYLLARPPREITMAQLIRSVDGTLAPVGCVSQSAHAPCRAEPSCALREVWQETREAVVAVLEGTTLQHVALRARALAGTSVPDYRI
jgi:Rrf2 family protein